MAFTGGYGSLFGGGGSSFGGMGGLMSLFGGMGQGSQKEKEQPQPLFIQAQHIRTPQEQTRQQPFLYDPGAPPNEPYQEGSRAVPPASIFDAPPMSAPATPPPPAAPPIQTQPGPRYQEDFLSRMLPPNINEMRPTGPVEHRAGTGTFGYTLEALQNLFARHETPPAPPPPPPPIQLPSVNDIPLSAQDQADLEDLRRLRVASPPAVEFVRTPTPPSVTPDPGQSLAAKLAAQREAEARNIFSNELAYQEAHPPHQAGALERFFSAIGTGRPYDRAGEEARTNDWRSRMLNLRTGHFPQEEATHAARVGQASDEHQAGRQTKDRTWQATVADIIRQQQLGEGNAERSVQGSAANTELAMRTLEEARQRREANRAQYAEILRGMTANPSTSGAAIQALTPEAFSGNESAQRAWTQSAQQSQISQLAVQQVMATDLTNLTQRRALAENLNRFGITVRQEELNGPPDQVAAMVQARIEAARSRPLLDSLVPQQ